MSSSNVFSLLFKRMFLLFLFTGLVILGAFRLAFIIRFCGPNAADASFSTLCLLAFNGLRFDLQVICWILIPLILTLAANFAIKSETCSVRSCRFLKYYYAFIFALLTVSELVDQQFYLNFNSHFNVVLFDFLKENPILLTKSMIKEQPVLFMLAVSITVWWILLKIYSLVVNENDTRSKKVYSSRSIGAVLAVSFILFGVCIRGSVRTFPLRIEDIYVSGDAMINDCVPNSIFMLKNAYSEKKKLFKVESEKQVLDEYGFKSLNEAVATYKGVSADGKKPIEDYIFDTTPSECLAKNYNFIFVITESWSNELLHSDFGGRDLLCSMRKHLNEDILFSNFQSLENGTINTVEEISVSVPYHSLFISKYRYHKYETSIATPFKQNGYHTAFISGIGLSWRNLGEVLPNQDFDEVIGKYELLKEKPSATYNETWGIYDHEMLSYVVDKLDKSDAPNFFLCLTSTNHTPFEFPKGYPLPPLNVKCEESVRFNQVKEATLNNYLRGFQYTNKSLGDFMTKLKASKHAQNTIVVIVGDHNVREILSYADPKFLKYRNSVPMYVYLPKGLKNKVHVDTSRYGSHCDVVPTFAPLLLPNTRYVNMGQNLFDPALLHSYSVNVTQTLAAPSDKEPSDRKAKAREAILKVYFQHIFSKIDAQ